MGQEGKAREARLGMWRGKFIAPWDWRRGDRLAAVPAAPRVEPKIDHQEASEHGWEVGG